MSDLLITLLVILGTGVLVLAIFYLTGAKRKEREKKLAEYCRDQGYVFSKVREPSQKEYIIKGDTFSFASTMTLLQYDSDPGNESWGKETIWSAAGSDKNRPIYALGSVPAGSWAVLPDLVKRAAIEKLRGETRLSVDLSNVKYLEPGGETAFLLFEERPGDGSALLKRIKPFLKELPAEFTLFIHSSPDMVRIKLVDCFVQDVKLLDKILSLGEAIGGVD